MIVPGAAWNPVFVPRLSALRTDGGVRFELLVPADVAEPLHAEFDQAVDARSLEPAIDAAARLLRASDAPTFWDEVRTTGGLLFRMLIPEPLRAPLARLAGGPLLVRTNMPAIPWEVLHDGTEFWGFSLALGKQTVAPAALLHEPASAAPSPSRTGVRRVLLIGSDPAGDLPFVAAEIEHLYRALEPVAEVRCLNGPLATFTGVTACLAEGFDIVHYCGHVVTDAGGPALLLADRQPLSADAIARNLAGRPVVFLNGCTSGRSHDVTGSGDPSTLVSLAERVLRARATSVVGTLRDVRDAYAARMAGTFYGLLFEHAPIGEALRRARLACREAPGDSAWLGSLAFVLFGNPAHVPVPAGTEPAVAPPPAASSPRPPQARAVSSLVSRRVVVGGAGLAAASLLGWVLARRSGRIGGDALPPPADDIVVWVQRFRNAAEQHRLDAFGATLSDGVGTRLRNLKSMMVYSATDTADVEQDGASELEIVRKLGVTKTVSGTYRVDGTALHATVRVVDVGTGSAELSSSADGSTSDVDAVVLDLAEIVAQTLRILRLMLDGEGQPPGRAPAEPGAYLQRGLALLGAAPALAADDAGEIRAFLERYRAAAESSDLDAIEALYDTFPPAQRASQARYFASIRELRVRLDIRDIKVTADEAVVSFQRADDFTDGRTGRPMHLEVELTKTLRRDGGDWKFSTTPRASQ